MKPPQHVSCSCFFLQMIVTCSSLLNHRLNCFIGNKDTTSIPYIDKNNSLIDLWISCLDGNKPSTWLLPIDIDNYSNSHKSAFFLLLFFLSFSLLTQSVNIELSRFSKSRNFRICFIQDTQWINHKKIRAEEWGRAVALYQGRTLTTLGYIW